MAVSMTGFAAGEIVAAGFRVQATIRAVNHRFLDFTYRAPEELLFLEKRALEIVQELLQRGSVTVYLKHISDSSSSGARVVFNAGVARSYLEQISHFQHATALSGSVEVNHLMVLPGVFTLATPATDSEALAEQFLGGFRGLVADVHTMRVREGANLCAAMLQGLEEARGHLRVVETRAPEHPQAIRQKLHNRIRDHFSDVNVEARRLEEEILFYAERADITEEIVRLRSHLEHLEAILASSQPVGRKLEFLFQEILREINTIGSKADDLEITRAVIDLKTINEQWKEQARNLA